MPTIREFTSALRQRPGVTAAIVSGRDGLLVEGAAGANIDLDDLAARLPALITEAISIGDAASLGSCTTCIIEYGAGYAVLTTLGTDSILTVLLDKSAELGAILFELRSQRSRLEALL